MRYEKPIAMDLNTGARRATGQGPLACLPGGTVTPLACHPGNLDVACYVGTGGDEYAGDCISGTSPETNSSCLPGTGAEWECAGGSAPGHPGPCASGPVP